MDYIDTVIDSVMYHLYRKPVGLDHYSHSEDALCMCVCVCVLGTGESRKDKKKED